MIFNWDDIRIFLEIQRTRRISHAARRLGLSHTTVARRLKIMEGKFGAHLFDSGDDGLITSETGDLILPRARDMETAAAAMSDQVAHIAEHTKSRVRVGAPDGFGNAVLSRILPEFSALVSEFEVELVPIPAVHKLWRRDVDIAISLDRPQTGRLVMRKLIDYDLRLYAGTNFFETHPHPKERADLVNYPFVGYIDELLYTSELDFNSIVSPGLNTIYRAATVKAQFDAVRCNIGLGVLPCFMARDSDLIPVLPDEIKFSRTYWLLFPEEYRELARIRKVSDFIFETTQGMADQFRY